MNAAGELLLERVRGALQDERGVQFESLLSCLGALAGYACQVSVRQQGAALVAVKTTDGSTYLYGDALNAPLAESPLSVWAFVAKAVQWRRSRHRRRQHRRPTSTTNSSRLCVCPTAAQQLSCATDAASDRILHSA
jgi:hypothetical protein